MKYILLNIINKIIFINNFIVIYEFSAVITTVLDVID